MTSCCYGDIDNQHVDKANLSNDHVVYGHVVRSACREDSTMTSSSCDVVTSRGVTLLTPAETAVHKLPYHYLCKLDYKKLGCLGETARRSILLRSGLAAQDLRD